MADSKVRSQQWYDKAMELGRKSGLSSDEIDDVLREEGFTFPYEQPKESVDVGQTALGKAGMALESVGYAADDVNQRTAAWAKESPSLDKSLLENTGIVANKGLQTAAEIGNYVGGKADEAIGGINAQIDKLPMGLSQFVKYNPMLQGPKVALNAISMFSPRTPTQAAFAGTTMGSPSEIASTFDDGIRGAKKLVDEVTPFGRTLSPGQRAAYAGNESIGAKVAQRVESALSGTPAAEKFANTQTAIENETIKASMIPKVEARHTAQEAKALEELGAQAKERVAQIRAEQDKILSESFDRAKIEEKSQKIKDMIDKLADVKATQTPDHPKLERIEVMGKELTQAIEDAHKDFRENITIPLYNAAHSLGSRVNVDTRLLKNNMEAASEVRAALDLLKEDKAAPILSGKIAKALEGQQKLSDLMGIYEKLGSYERQISDEGTKRAVTELRDAIGGLMRESASNNKTSQKAISLYDAARAARTRQASLFETKGMDAILIAGEASPGTVMDKILSKNSPVDIDQLMHASPRGIQIAKKGSFELAVEAINKGNGGDELAAYIDKVGVKRFELLHSGEDAHVLDELNRANIALKNSGRDKELQRLYAETEAMLEKVARETKTARKGILSQSEQALKDKLAQIERQFPKIPLDRRAGSAGEAINRRATDKGNLEVAGGVLGTSLIGAGQLVGNKTLSTTGAAILAASGISRSPRLMAKVYYSKGGRAAVNAVLSAPTVMEAMKGMATIKGITKGIIPAGTASIVGKSNLGKQARQPDWSFLKGNKKEQMTGEASKPLTRGEAGVAKDQWEKFGVSKSTQNLSEPDPRVLEKWRKEDEAARKKEGYR